MIIDASSLLLASEKGKLDKVKGSETVSLIYYEVGNAIWKDTFLHRRVDFSKAKEVLRSLYEFIMDHLFIREVNPGDVLEIATKFGITFYDACYVWLALRNNEILLTEDKNLREKIKKYVYVKSVLEI